MSSSAVKSIPNILGRSLIKRDIVFQDFDGKVYTYDDLCLRINQAKNVLIDYGVERESLITIIDLSTSINYLAFMFAGFELGCVLHTPLDDMWPEENRYKVLECFSEYNKRTNRWGMTNTILIHGLDEEISKGVTKRDIDSSGFGKFLMSLLPREHIPFSRIEEFSDEYNQPWEVTPDTLVCMTTADWNKGVGWTPKFHTHQEVLNKAEKVVDIFGYRDKNIALTKNHGHMSALELLIVPSMMSAKKVYELPLPDVDYGGTMDIIIAILERALIKNRIDILFGYDEDVHSDVRIPKRTKVLRYDEHIYGDMESLPKCL